MRSSLQHSLRAGVVAIALLAAALPRLTGADESPRVTAADWYWGPANRWSWMNMRRIFPTAGISRGDGPVAPLKEAPRDLSKIVFADPVSGKRMTVDDMLRTTYTDGFIVLKDGAVVTEKYYNGMTRKTPHLVMSVTKSFVGTLAGILAERGLLNTEALVTSYLPELQGTVFDEATVRNLLDMTVAAKIGDDPYTPIDQAAGWLPPDPTSPHGLREFLPSLKDRQGRHGARFIYLDPSPQVLAWIIERLTRSDFSKVLETHIWSKLGAEADAYLVLDHYQEPYTTPGLNATLTDLARFGQMMAQGGRYNGQQIVPQRWVAQIRAGGSREAWDAALAAGQFPGLKQMPGYLHGSYRDYWWVTDARCGRMAAIGIGAQLLVVDPIANMVVIKLSSTPDVEIGETMTTTAYAAADAIIRQLSGHGC